MNTVISNYYASLEENLNHLKCLKLKDHLVVDLVEVRAEILVDAECLDSAGDFNPEHLGYITHIFENISDHILHIRSTHKYKEVKEFIKKLHIFDEDTMQT